MLEEERKMGRFFKGNKEMPTGWKEELEDLGVEKILSR